MVKFSAMAELTNLTDRLSHLRDRKGGSPIVQGGSREPRHDAPRSAKKPRPRSPERRFANDYFMVFVYALLSIALLTQLVLIVSLDIL